MFWNNYIYLCRNIKKKPNAVAEELGISSGTVTGWKRGATPSTEKLEKIASFFGVTINDLLNNDIEAASRRTHVIKENAPIKTNRDEFAKILNELTEQQVDEWIDFGNYLLSKK
jgi:transcriptional regulator with XRE-family HTH domain